MFWSKIWFFLVAVVAGVTLTLALVMPRPAERATVTAERSRLSRACSITEILLRDFAQSRIELARETARVQGLDVVLLESSRTPAVSAASYSAAKKILADEVSFGTQRKGDQETTYRPDLLLALDARGRVVARSGRDENLYGDSLAGYFLIDDALDGYLRDDLWILGGQLYLVAAAPVITAREPEYAGAVVIGEAVDKEFATELARRWRDPSRPRELDVDLTFYAAGEAVAASDPAQLHKDVLARSGDLAKKPPGQDCRSGDSFSIATGDTSYWVLLARLPGEAGAMGAFYSVHIPQERAIGFAGTIKAVKKNDLSFANFPWVRVAVVFLLMVGVGIALMIFEADKPLRALSADVVRLAKGETERLAEEQHRGKFGSIARSVNIALDKLHREARSAKRDLDQVLGPLPDQEVSGARTPTRQPDLAAAFTPPPPPPPPSEFRFTDGGMRMSGPPGTAPAHQPGPHSGFPAFEPGPATHGAPPAKPATTDDRVPAPQGGSLPPVGKRPTGAVPRLTGPRPTMSRRAASPGAPGAEGSAPGATADDHVTSPTSTGRTQHISIEDEDEEETVVAGRRGGVAAMIEAAAAGRQADTDDGPQYRAIFDEFVALKRRCGESVDNLTFERFLTKLRTNRDALIAKHGCRTVKFQVYVKDGKAALKASPVR
jgi:hypothetical protein